MGKNLISYLIYSMCLFNYFLNIHGYNIAVIGTGYVGLVVGAGLAELDHTVTCVDIDVKKIAQLKNHKIPIYEPELAELVIKNEKKGNLHFSTKILDAVTDAEIIFLAVGTPSRSDGSADLTAVMNAINTIFEISDDNYRIIVNKSTVPIGFGEILKKIIKKVEKNIDIVSNPEFLREGSAVHDFFHPNRIVIGSNNKKSADIIHELYKHLGDIPYVVTDVTTAETIKYAANAFLALKISYINEIATLCEKTGADIHMVTHGIGLDPRIGSSFLKCGPGFGGSCFPKDTKALLHIASSHNIELKTVKAAVDANESRKHHIVELVQDTLGDLTDKNIGVWGITFKADTDDVRESPSITIIQSLHDKGAHIKVYDPLGMENMKKIFPFLDYCDTKEQARTGVDLLLILTEWEEFKKYTPSHIPVIDTRNIMEKEMTE